MVWSFFTRWILIGQKRMIFLSRWINVFLFVLQASDLVKCSPWTTTAIDIISLLIFTFLHFHTFFLFSRWIEVIHGWMIFWMFFWMRKVTGFSSGYICWTKYQNLHKVCLMICLYDIYDLNSISILVKSLLWVVLKIGAKNWQSFDPFAFELVEHCVATERLPSLQRQTAKRFEVRKKLSIGTMFDQ